MIGDFLYQLTPKDEQSIGMQIFAEKLTVTAVVASQSLSIPVPGKERLLIVTNVFADASGAGGQTVSSLQISRNATNVPDVVVKSSQPVTAFAALGFEGFMILGPEEEMQASASYSAAIAANSLRLFVHGYTIPRGVINI